MTTQGWYYLHDNGELIYKPDMEGIVADFRESDLVKAFWSIDPSDRMTAWNLLVEALAAGAKPSRVQQLAAKWGCNDQDAEVYADRLGLELVPDGDQICARHKNFTNLQECPAGFGRSCLEALADFADQLGYAPQKLWGSSFTDLVGATP